MRILILIALIYLLYRLVKGLKGLKGPEDSAERDRGVDVIDDMVQDPNCGTYVPRSDAVRRRFGGEEVFFCSETCADEYKSKEHDEG